MRGIVTSAPPNGGVVGGLIVLGAFLNCCVSVGIQYNLGVLLSSFARDVEFSSGYSTAALSWFGSLESALFLLSALPAGMLIDRIGVRLTSLLGLSLMFLGFFFSYVATSVPALIFSFSVFVGMGCAFLSVACNVHVNRVFTTRRASASGLAVSGSGAGGAVLGPLIQYLVDKYGWRQAMLIVGAFCAITAFIGTVLLIPVTVASDAGQSAHTQQQSQSPALGASEWYGTVGFSDAPSVVALETEGVPEVAKAPKKLSIFELLRNARFARYLAAIVAFGTGHFVILTHFNRAVRESATSAPDAALLITLQGSANFVGRIFLGFFADTVSQNLSKIALLQICFASVSVVAAVLAIPAVGSSFSFQAFFMFVHGGLGSSVASLQGPIAADLIGIENISVGFSLVNAMQSPLTAIIPPLGGALRDATGSYSAVWAMVAVNVAASVAALATLPPGIGGPLACPSCISRKTYTSSLVES